MITPNNAKLNDLLEQFLDMGENQAIDDIIHTSLTGIMIWVIKRSTSKEERDELIERTLVKFRENAKKGFDDLKPKPTKNSEFDIQLDKNLECARVQLRSLLIR